MNGKHPGKAQRYISRLVQHGASLVSVGELVTDGQIIWRIGADQEVSEACLHAEEFMASATRNCCRANSVVVRMGRAGGRKDADLMTALKKYVEDTCGGIKEVDNQLKRNGTSLEALLSEIPGGSDDQMSWRGLIGRRDVIAHQLLTVDDERVYREAVRDFGLLEQLISRVHFAPIKTNFASGRGAGPLMRTAILRELTPTAHSERPRIGNCIVFIYEDEVDGFVCIRMGRTATNKITLAVPRPMYFSVMGVDGMENIKDDEGVRTAILASHGNEQRTFVDPKGRRTVGNAVERDA